MRIDELFVKGTEARGHLSEASNALHDIDRQDFTSLDLIRFEDASNTIDEAMRYIDLLLADPMPDDWSYSRECP